MITGWNKRYKDAAVFAVLTQEIYRVRWFCLDFDMLAEASVNENMPLSTNELTKSLNKTVIKRRRRITLQLLVKFSAVPDKRFP